MTVLELVDQAAHTAAQDVAAIHRRRLVVQSFLAALLAALLISIPVALVSSNARQHDARANSRYNCRTLRTISGTISQFVASDAKLRYKQQHYAQRARVIAAFSKILDKGLLNDLQARADKIDTDTQAFWTQRLQPRLDHLAGLNCVAAIR